MRHLFLDIGPGGIAVMMDFEGIGWLLFLCGWSYVSILLHESSHWLAAKAVGFRPVHLVVGSGPVLKRISWGNLQFVLHLVPLGGRLISMWDTSRGLRWKGALYAAAGPFCDALLLLLLWRTLHAVDAGEMPTWFMRAIGGSVALGMVFQALLLLNNLLPQRVISDGWATRSDGLMVWEFATGQISSDAGVTGENYRDYIRRYDTGFNSPRAWFDESPPPLRDAYVKLVIASVEGDHTTVLACGQTVLAAKGMSAGERAAVLDQMASIVAVAGKLSHLEQALSWAKEAVTLCPDAPTLRGTLGGLLVLDDRPAEGLEHLLPLTDETADPLDRSISYAYLGLAYQRLGRTDQADDALAASERIGESHGVAAWIRQMIEAERSHSS